MKIAIITDSTCDWHFEDYAARGVTMVPLKICFGEESFTDQYEISSEDFYDKMAAFDGLPTTSQPSPHDFALVFERLASEGYEGAICLHIAHTLSGTPQAAQIAAAESAIPVKVLDSRGASGVLGLLVDEACRLRDEEGITLDDMYARLDAYRDSCRILIAPETLDNLVKGGRLPEEAAQQAGLLNIRMIFSLCEEDGRVTPVDKVKGSKGAIARLVSAIEQFAAEHGPVRLRLLSARNQKAVDKLTAALDEAGVDYEVASTDAFGATVATHLGMGCLGVAFAPRA